MYGILHICPHNNFACSRLYKLLCRYTNFFGYVLTYVHSMSLCLNSLRTRGLLIKVNYLNTIVPKMTRLLKIVKIFSRIVCIYNGKMCSL